MVRGAAMRTVAGTWQDPDWKTPQNEMSLGTRLLCDFRRLDHMWYSNLDLYWISPGICRLDFRLFIEKIASIQSVLDLRGFGV